MHNLYFIIFLSYDSIPFLNLHSRVGHYGNGLNLFWPRVLPEISHFDVRKLTNIVQALCSRWNLRRFIFPLNGDVLRTYYVPGPLLCNRRLRNKNNIWESWMWSSKKYLWEEEIRRIHYEALCNSGLIGVWS